MTDEEMRGTMEFLLRQQAQYAARMDQDQSRLTRLEDAFVTLVQLAKLADERMDFADERMNRFDGQIKALGETIAALAGTQAHGDERLNALIDVVERYISREKGEEPQL